MAAVLPADLVSDLVSDLAADFVKDAAEYPFTSIGGSDSEDESGAAGFGNSNFDQSLQLSCSVTTGVEPVLRVESGVDFDGGIDGSADFDVGLDVDLDFPDFPVMRGILENRGTRSQR